MTKTRTEHEIELAYAGTGLAWRGDLKKGIKGQKKLASICGSSLYSIIGFRLGVVIADAINNNAPVLISVLLRKCNKRELVTLCPESSIEQGIKALISEDQKEARIDKFRYSPSYELLSRQLYHIGLTKVCKLLAD